MPYIIQHAHEQILVFLFVQVIPFKTAKWYLLSNTLNVCKEINKNSLNLQITIKVWCLVQ